MNMRHRLLPGLVLLAVAAGFSGCATAPLKGTPFYSKAPDLAKGDAADRIYAWPLLYYRNPTLSVLWPIFEHSDDHAAVRPLFSVYRLDEPRHEYNVLWPLAQFDRKNSDNRIFPVYWGDDYASVFPLYWHNGTPSAGNGFDSLFPLWIYNNDPGPDYSLHLLWPLYNRKHDGPTSGWRLWPLAADWREEGGRYNGWYAWPLGWRWGNTTRHSRLLLPLFYQESAPDDSTFASLLGGWHDEPAAGWGYLVPFGFHSRDARADRWYTLLGGSRTESDGDRSWYAVPAVPGGSREGARRDVWAGGPLFHYRTDGASTTTHLLPLYFSASSERESLFLSLPYSSHRDANGRWNMVPPVWFHSQDSAGSLNVTPLYMWGRDNRSGEPWSAIPPLYYHRDEANGDTFLSPLYSTWTGENHYRRTLVPPGLTYYSGGPSRSDLWTLAGLAHLSWGEQPGSSHLFPLYYRSQADHLTLSPLWSSWESADRSSRVRVVPPLLSWTDSDARGTSLHLLLAWAKFSSREHETEWLLPFYYRDPEQGLVLSPLYARRRDGRQDDTAFPLLLSWLDREPDSASLYLLLGLAKFSGGKAPEDSWLLPLYYRNPATRTFLSLPYAHWTEADRSGVAIPLLLSGYSHTDTERDLRILLGLYGRSWSTRPGSDSESWLFPLYASGKNYFLTPLAGRWTDRTTFTYFPTPLFGWRSGATHGSWLFPLYAYSSDPATKSSRLWYLPWGSYRSWANHSESVLFPLYDYECDAWTDAEIPTRGEGRQWNILYLAAYENRREPIMRWDAARRQSTPVAARYEAHNRLVPLWWYERTIDTQTKQLEKDFSLLLIVQDYWRKEDLGDHPKTDYTRTRVLWKGFSYERDHDIVSVDLFPAITYDRNGQSLRQVSFLWRGFRYKRKDGQKAVDLLFIPVWRTSWVAKD